jgi:hypothetical protein
MKRATLILVTLTLMSGGGGQAKADLLPLPPEISSFTGSTRGYWFTAPTDFHLTGIQVPTDQSTAPQSVEIVKLNSTPPIFPSGTNSFTNLFYAANVPGSNFIPTDLQIHTGDIIGVLGSRDGAINSYGAQPFTSSIFGFPVTLARFGFQDNLATIMAHDVFTEPSSANSFLGRVEIQFDAGAVPEPSSLALLTLGGLGLAGWRRWRKRRYTTA